MKRVCKTYTPTDLRKEKFLRDISAALPKELQIEYKFKKRRDRNHHTPGRLIIDEGAYLDLDILPGEGPASILTTIFHELGHLIVGHMSSPVPPPNSVERREKECEAWKVGWDLAGKARGMRKLLRRRYTSATKFCLKTYKCSPEQIEKVIKYIKAR